MLYLALYFPLLPLESLSCPLSPSALVARGRILMADPAGQEAGIHGGMRLASALGCLPQLQVLERRPEQETLALERLALWAGNWTPLVALRPSQGLLLEIGGCLRLFGGLGALLELLQRGLAELGHSWQLAVAPTPLGAWWLACHGGTRICADLETLGAALALLPTSLPEWPATVRERLQSFGLESLGALRALPLGSLRERLGPRPVEELCQAWGELPDQPAWHVFPEHFRQRLELPWKVEASTALLFPARRLGAALLGWLESRGGLLRRAAFLLEQGEAGMTRVELAFTEPGRDLSRLLRLLEEKLARVNLDAPVQAMTLELEAWSEARESRKLFGSARGEGALACLERLAVQLGEGRVHGLALRADHRPELAWRPSSLAELASNWQEERLPAGPEATLQAQPLRPSWLLPEPLALEETRRGLLSRQGPLGRKYLQLLSPPERIESGWWDVEGQGDLRRDYFVAGCASGERAWVFRDRKGWFLHGLFA